MHAFALVMGSVLGHEFACTTITKAQQIVTYFRAATRAKQTLREEGVRHGIKCTLQTSNKTRFTSIHICLTSVLTNEDALKVVCKQDVVQNTDVKAIVEDRAFWLHLQQLCKLLAPFSKVIMAIQRREAKLAGG